LILSRRPDSWDDFFLALKDTEIPKDFLSPKDRKQGNQIRDPLDGVNE
jgi:antitoxin VapB